MKLFEILNSLDCTSSLLIEGISPEQAVQLIGREAVIDYLNSTPVRLLGGKKNEMVGRVTKINRNWPVKFTAQGDYELAMRQQPGQEEFKSKSGWGSCGDNGLIEQNGKIMIQAISVGRSETTYLLDGRPIPKEQIIGLPPAAPRAEGQVPVIRLDIDKIQLVR